MTINILFLSDLHFGASPYKKEDGEVTNTAVARRRNVIEKWLFPCLEGFLIDNPDWHPHVLIITGDLAWKAAKKEFEQAKNWILELIKILKIESNYIAICPGNHDLERNKTNGKTYLDDREKVEKEFNENLSTLETTFSNYIDFYERNFETIPIFNERESPLIGTLNYEINKQCLRIIILNSSWYHFDDNAKGKLWLGYPFLNQLSADGCLADIDHELTNIITISILHHPDDWFHPSESKYPPQNHPDTFNFLSDRSHIILSGHEHPPLARRPDTRFSRALHFIGGATYNQDDYENNFLILKIDPIEKYVKRTIFRFNPSSTEWIYEFDKEEYKIYSNQNKKKIRFYKEFSDFKYEIILKDKIVKPFRPDGPQIGDFEAIGGNNDWIYVPTLVEELFEDLQSGKMILLIGKPATGKSVMVRYIGFKSIKELENDVFYIDFINTDQRDKEIFLENMVNFIKHPTFETLKIDKQSPIFILENIHDPELRRLKIGRKSLIKSLKSLEGKVKLIMTTREDITEISDLNWIGRDIIIDLNQKSDLNKEIIFGILEKVKAKPFNKFFKTFNRERKDKIENLWLFGWFFRVLTNAGDITSATGDGFKRDLRKVIKEYYNMRNFPGNNQFLPEQILTVLLILSTLSKYETNMEKQFIIDYGLHYFDHFTKQDLEDIIQLLLENKEISISREHLTIRFEYRIPHIKLAEILLDYYANEEIIITLKKIFDNYIKIGKNVSHLGYNLGMAGDHKKAILCFKKEMESNPQNANNLESLGLAYAYTTQYDEAIEVFKKVVEIEADRVHSWYCLGLSYNKKSYYDEAIESFEKAIIIDSNHFNAWDNLGLAQSGKGQYDKAIEAHKKAISIKSNHDNAWLNLGTAYNGKEQYDEAIEAFKRAISIEQNDDDAWYNLGFTYNSKEQYDEAIEAYKKAIEIKHNKIYAWNDLGVVYIKKKKYDKAIEVFEKAIEIDSREGGIWYNIACALSRKNNKKRALECLRKAIGIDKEKYINLARNDEDFNNIRDSEDFRKLLDSS